MGRGREQRHAEAVDGSGASSTFNGQTGNSLAREPPVVSGGARARQHEDADDFGVRRSQRAWKPSQGCLANIAHVCRDVLQAEEEMDQMSSLHDIGLQVPIVIPWVPPPQDSRVVHSAIPTSEHFLAFPQMCVGGKAQTSALEGDHTQGASDHIFWFWESVFSAAESEFCPKKHAEAMALRYGRRKLMNILHTYRTVLLARLWVQ